MTFVRATYYRKKKTVHYFDEIMAFARTLRRSWLPLSDTRRGATGNSVTVQKFSNAHRHRQQLRCCLLSAGEYALVRHRDLMLKAMKKQLFFSMIAVISVACRAADVPVVGVFEQIPVMTNDGRIIARPAYIITDQRLLQTVVFSGLLSGGTALSVECCFEVKKPVPIVLDDELAKYKQDAEFVAHMKALKGYHYIYAAQPSTDRHQWTPLVTTVVNSASNPDDGTPFSIPVIAARFGTSRVPDLFTAAGSAVTLRVRFDKRAARTSYIFTQDGRKVEFSEADFPH